MIITPPNDINQIDTNKKTIFLAGSIEMWIAHNRQEIATEKLSDNYNIYNPRRPDRDNSRKQDYDDVNFHQQVNRELDALAKSDFIIMYFDPNTKSPILLLELWLYADSKKIAICCPEWFWRRGNIEAIADRYNIPLFTDLNEIIEYIYKKG